MTVSSPSNTLLRSSSEEWAVSQAIREISGTYGDTVSVTEKKKSLIKFGINPDVGTTEEMVWANGGIETLATGNTIDTLSSSNAGDDQTVTIEGHTLSGADLTFVVQTSTVNGQNKVTLTTPLYRATRMYNTGSTDFAGDVYVYEDDTIVSGVPQTSSKVHLKAGAGDNQSLKCATSVSSVDYWIVTGLTLGVNKSVSRAVAFKFQVREFGSVFRTRFFCSCSSDTGSIHIPFYPCIIVKKNSDVRVLATSSGATTGVEASIHGHLAVVV